VSQHDLDAARSLALIELERSEHEHLGDGALATAIRVAQYLSVPMTAIALVGGLTRTRAYALLERTAHQPATRLSRSQMRRLAACVLEPDRSIAVGTLATELHIDIGELVETLRWLHDQGIAEILVQRPQPDRARAVSHWIAGPQREAWLEVQLQSLRWVTSDRYAVYVRLPDGIGGQVALRGDRLSATMIAVISAGTARSITWDELAIAVAAEDPRDALDTARAVWADAVLPLAPTARFDVTLLLAPTQRSRAR
jgi:hypothetical protein